ncbi:MAG: glycosyltransferase family 4 protein [Ktedonobacteraceae bacterium]|nr:glycosyltransferase family 4 protein [Ktedonobacteraceae bacterium]MBO0795256.1 glycosyltransferase family 4 protein [Ktedonobacteraceae bacterium]
MSDIRVCTITFDWYPFDPLVRRIAEAAIDGGYEMDVICLRQRGEKSHEVCNGVQVYRVPMDRGFGKSLFSTLLSWCWFIVLASVKVTLLHLRRRYAVIHVHNMPDFLVFAALVPRLSGAKVVLHIQDVSPELLTAKSGGKRNALVYRLAIWQERLSTAFAQHVITVGTPFERLLLQRGVPPQKMTIILNSADPRIFPAARRAAAPPIASNPDRPFILMYHGTVAERNGLDTAVRALALVQHEIPQVRLDIQGRGEYLEVVKQLAEELGAGERVVFTPPCPSERIVDFVVHGDVGIIPYRSDGFMELVLPTKAYEFAWMQRPIIASDTPAIRSMFRSESMELCDPTQPESWAAAIIDLYRHPQKRVRMVASAAEDYQSYQWEVMAHRYQQLIALLSQKRLVGSLTTVSREG